MATDPPTTKPGNSDLEDPEVVDLEKQTARLVARQKLTDVRLGLLASALPTSPGVTDAPANTVTFDKAGSLAPWLAQSVVATLAEDIANNVWAVFYPVPAAPSGESEESGESAGGVVARAEAAQQAAQQAAELAQAERVAAVASAEAAESARATSEASAEQAEAAQAAIAQALEELAASGQLNAKLVVRSEKPEGPSRSAGPDASQPRVIFVTDDPELLATDVLSRQVELALQARRNELSARAGAIAGATKELTDAVTQYGQDEAKRTQDHPAQGAERRRRLLEAVEQIVTDAETTATEAHAAKTDGATAAEADGAAATGEAAGAAAAAAGAGALGVAVDLVRLLGVDYTVKAAEVTADSALLARLTAGQLALAHPRKRPADQVLLDGFALADDSATLRSYRALYTVSTKVLEAMQQLTRDVAPVSSAAEVYRVRAEAKEGELDAAEAADAPDEDEVKVLRSEATELRARFEARSGAAAPAQKLLEDTKAALEAVRTEMTTLATADTSGNSPLQRACSRDRLHHRGDHDTNPVTHILLVQATHAGADVVTRRSILGASGRVGYLGGANGAWIMVGTNGTIAGGGAVEAASSMTHDIATGATSRNPIKPRTGKLTSTDPLETNEKWIRVGVLLLALAVALAGVVTPVVLAILAINN